MFAWIASNIGTILITLVLVVIVAAIIHSLRQQLRPLRHVGLLPQHKEVT